MEWGKNDCLIDLFGEDAHQKINWVKAEYEETWGWILSLSAEDRLKVWCSTFEGNGYIRVEKPQPGDCAIGNFKMGVIQDLEIPKSWYAQFGNDHHWYIKLLNCRRVAEYVGNIVIFRWPFLQQH